MTNVELLKQAYADFATGNVPGVLAVFDPSIEWYECKGMPFATGDGFSRGPDAVVNDVFMQIPVYFDGFNISVNEVFGVDDKVVMSGYYQGTYKPTGKPFKANATDIWTIKNGKLAHFFQAVDTVAIVS